MHLLLYLKQKHVEEALLSSVASFCVSEKMQSLAIYLNISEEMKPTS